jgi:hypothetical protein
MAEGVFYQTDINPCFQRFIHDSWSAQGVNDEATWAYLPECARTLRDALFSDFSCFNDTSSNFTCTCTDLEAVVYPAYPDLNSGT